MKGVMSFLERTGFVQKKDSEGEADVVDTTSGDGGVSAAIQPTEPQPPVETQLTLSLEEIYAAAGVPPSNYAAEKLLRLLDGLKAMDEGTRRAAVQAMDAADDAWTIEDPVRDASLKATALAAHADSLRVGLEQSEQENTSRVGQVKDREVETVADIRRQIADLEGLMNREISRSAEEQATLAAELQAKRDGVARQINSINITVADFRRLVTQFGATPQAQSPPGA